MVADADPNNVAVDRNVDPTPLGTEAKENRGGLSITKKVLSTTKFDVLSAPRCLLYQSVFIATRPSFSKRLTSSTKLT